MDGKATLPIGLPPYLKMNPPPLLLLQ